MAEIVGAFGVPHTPRFPVTAREDTPLGEELRRLYGVIGQHLRDSGPDVVIVFSTDHFHTYFKDLPIFAIGLAESTYGPSDNTEIPPYKMEIDTGLGGALYEGAVTAGFDLCLSQEFALDHSFVVPYHFLVGEQPLPIIPIFVSGMVAPLPSAQRCAALGAVLREAIEGYGDTKRVAVIASGSFSLDLGGAGEGVGGANGGVPDSAWVDRVISLLGSGSTSTLAEEAQPEQLRRAGNIGGELLNWMAMAGMLDGTPPDHLERQQPFGHAYGAWRQGSGR